MINKKLLIFLIYCDTSFGMSMASDMAINLFASLVGKAAEKKMHTEGYKSEQGYVEQAAINLVDKEKAKTNNLKLISSIKNSIIQKIELNKNENSLVFDPLTKIIYTSYKNFISLIDQFRNKYNQLVKQGKNNMLVKLGILIINEALNEYLSLLNEYNQQLQNVAKKIDVNAVSTINNNFIIGNSLVLDDLTNVESLMQKLDSYLLIVDNQSDLLIANRDLLSSNNISLFNTIVNKILDIVANMEAYESKKNVSDPSQLFYNFENQLNAFSDKLFDELTQFNIIQSEALSYLYKNIALLNINYNKIVDIILYINNSIENPHYTLNNFIKDLYKDLLESNSIISETQYNYVNVLLKNNTEFNSLIVSLRTFLLFLVTNINKLEFSSLNEFLNRANNSIFNYSNQMKIKNKTLINDIFYFSYIDNYLVDAQNDAIKLQYNIKKIRIKSQSNIDDTDSKQGQMISKINVIPENSIFDVMYRGRLKRKNKSKDSHTLVIKKGFKKNAIQQEAIHKKKIVKTVKRRLKK